MNRPSRSSRSKLALSILLTLLGAAGLEAADWPRWLGPSQDGRTTGLAERAGDNVGLALAWKQKLGLGYSGIAVVGDRAVTMFGDGKSDWIVAFDAASGKELWRHLIGPMYPSLGGSEGGPSGMPVVADGVVYGLGAKGHLLAVRLDDGKELWSLRIDEQLGARPANFGFATVPLVAGDVLFVQAGGDAGRSLVGFDRRTGKIKWSTGDDRVGYQSPILATLGGREQIVAITNRAVYGLVPETGEVLWSREQGEAGSEDGAASPVLLGDDRFLLTGDTATKAFRVTRDGTAWRVEELWSTAALKSSLATPVVHDDHIYGFDGDFLTCAKVENGEKVWKSRPPGGRGLILVDGHLLIFGNDGAMVVAAASPDGYREKARLAVADSGTFTYPSFAGGRIFVRNTRDFAAVTIAAAAPAAQATVAAAPEARNAFERFLRRLESSDVKRLAIDDFMASQPRFPIVEDDRWIHFVYRGDTEDVAITGSMTELEAEEPLARVEGTDLFYRSYPIEPGLRWEYRFNVGFENTQPDPLNPRRVAGREGDASEIATSDWKRPDWLRPYEGPARGRVERFEWASEILGNARSVDVYLPPGYERGTARYPVLVVEDGASWIDKGHLPNVLNHLAGRQMAPLVVAFVHLPEGNAGEIGGPRADDHVRALADELVPKLDATYRTLTAPASRAVLGAGSAGMMAAYVAASRPEVFGKAAVCSPSLRGPTADKLVAALDAYTARAPKPEFRLSWNRYDLRRREWNLDVARDAQRLEEALEKNGFRVAAEESRDSSGWGGWPVRAGEMLQAIFPL